MKFKMFSRILCWCGVGIILLAFFPHVVLALSASNEVYGILKTIIGASRLMLVFGIPLSITGAIWHRHGWGERPACPLRTSLVTVGLSAVGALGLECLFHVFVMAVFGERHLHPRAYPFYLSVGFASGAIFLLLISLYISCRKNNWSLKGVLFDILISILLLPPFVIALFVADEVARNALL